jgi:serine/threonine protein kinase
MGCRQSAQREEPARRRVLIEEPPRSSRGGGASTASVTSATSDASSASSRGTDGASVPGGARRKREKKARRSHRPRNVAGVPELHQIVIQTSNVLGRGGYGVVDRAYNRKTKQALAVKECVFDKDNVGLITALRTEFETLASLSHPHIVNVYSFTIHENKVARIFMEIMTGSLRSTVVRLGGRLSETSARRALHQALLGLAYLHASGIIHRDIKPDNMLLDEHGCLKLSDFGTSKTTLHAASGTTTMVVGTVMYMAPETITGRYSQASDVWALAATFIEIVSGRLPWSELKFDLSIAMLFHIGNVQPPEHHPRIPEELLSPHGAAVLRRCFAFDPRARPSAAELLADRYFSFATVDGTDADHDLSECDSDGGGDAPIRPAQPVPVAPRSAAASVGSSSGGAKPPLKKKTAAPQPSSVSASPAAAPSADVSGSSAASSVASRPDAADAGAPPRHYQPQAADSGDDSPATEVSLDGSFISLDADDDDDGA